MTKLKMINCQWALLTPTRIFSVLIKFITPFLVQLVFRRNVLYNFSCPSKPLPFEQSMSDFTSHRFWITDILQKIDQYGYCPCTIAGQICVSQTLAHVYCLLLEIISARIQHHRPRLFYLSLRFCKFLCQCPIRVLYYYTLSELHPLVPFNPLICAHS